MPRVLVERERNGQKEYYCKQCGYWVKGGVWTGTGYPELICEDCGTTLVDDYHGYHEMERNGTDTVTENAD